MKVVAAQIPNSIDKSLNFQRIMQNILSADDMNADVILFPEAALSGFYAAKTGNSLDEQSKYLEEIRLYSQASDLFIILPTIVTENNKHFNTGYVFHRNQVTRFFKMGLTEPEKMFFSLPGGDENPNKVITIKDKKIALLICYEAQQTSWTYFNPGEVDAIFWPGYWGWNENDLWSDLNSDAKENLIYKNMQEWKVPLIQANFSENQLPNLKNGPLGLSVSVDANNQLITRGTFRTDDLIISYI